MVNTFRRLFLVLLFPLLLLLFGVSAAAAGEITVSVDGRTVEFQNPPVLESGRLLVPLREIFMAMGAAVSWDARSNTASAVRDNVTVTIPVGSYLPTINDLPVAIDLPAMFIGSCTYVPLRFAAESLGGEVRWQAERGAVFIATAADTGRRKDLGEGESKERGKIDLNSATLENLLEVEGVGEGLAQEILEFRRARGGFRTFEELKELPSMTEELYEALTPRLLIKYREEGLACWYGDKFHGRMTSSGEVYNKHLFTAAHRTLPFGTLVKVTFPTTGRSVWVRINDRGPHVAGRIIDLSHGAAEAIGLKPYGIGLVELEVVLTR